MTTLNGDTKKPQSPFVGLWLLLLKLGGKFGPLLFKVFKGLKFGKFAMLGASFGAYALLFSWEFAVVLIAAIFFHEMGHIWAMKQCGLKTKGVYFIPLLGAAAVSEDAFPSRKAEVVIALMGPIWGFGLALVTYGLYLVTGSPLVAALAGWMAMLNLFNLLPINPLDGGRVLKSVAYSIDSKLGFYVMAGGLASCFLLANYVGFGLITFILFIGVLELLGEVRTMRQSIDRERIYAKLESLALLSPDIQDKKKSILETIRRHVSSKYLHLEQSNLVPEIGFDKSTPIEECTHVRTLKSKVDLRDNMSSQDIALLSDELRQEYGYAEHRFGTGFSTDAITAAVLTVARSACIIRPNWFSPGGSCATADEFFHNGESLIQFLEDEKMPSMNSSEAAFSFGAYLALGTALAWLMFAVSEIPAASAALAVFMN